MELSDVLFLYRPGDGTGTFTRSGVATYLDGANTLQTAATGIRRDAHRVVADGIPYLLMERSRTNLVADSDDLTAWTSSGTPVVTAAADSLGDLDLSKVEDDNAAATEFKHISPSFTGDAVKAVSFYVAEPDTQATEGHAVILRDTVAGVDRLRVELLWTAGVPAVQGTPTGTVLALTFVGLTAGDKRCYRAVCQTTAVTAANAHELRAVPAVNNTSYTGDMYVGGFQAEDATYPTSLIQTSGGTDSRNADQLLMDYPYAPVAATTYARFVHLAEPNWVASGGVFPRVLTIGDNSGGDPRLLLAAVTGGDAYSVDHDTGATAVSSDVDLNPSYGDDIELLAKRFSDGSVQLQGRKNGGSIVTGSQSAALSFAGAWSAAEIQIGSVGANGSADMAIRSIAEAAGTAHSMEDMVRLASTPYVAFDDGTRAIVPQLTPTFNGWSPDVREIADRSVALGTGITTQFLFRTDYLASFRLEHLPPEYMDEAMRLKRHLLGGGSAELIVNDLDHNAYTVRLTPQTEPAITREDGPNIEYAMDLSVFAGSALTVRYG